MKNGKGMNQPGSWMRQFVQERIRMPGLQYLGLPGPRNYCIVSSKFIVSWVGSMIALVLIIQQNLNFKYYYYYCLLKQIFVFSVSSINCAYYKFDISCYN